LNYIIEIATTDFISTKFAVEGGADRIELCAALSDGGTTPSFGTIKKCRESFDVPLFPIIRSRSGDFLYSDEEFELMMEDIRVSKSLVCDGVVIGLLNKDGTIDKKRTAKMVEAAYPMEVSFHRAFDRCIDPFKALEELIEIGCQRILTSGQKPAAIDATEMISQLVKAADDRIIIMPGSGIRKDNIKEIAGKTGALEFHSSLRGKRKSKMDFIHPAFSGSEESYTNPYIDPEEVKALHKALRE
jgi:copper homeostasis protein